ncbi:Gamma-interferon-inducible lysosomal thiol reductase-like 1 [Homarus americanus]|uniref:Gamma-interferon-inducible lysosomal thiol reductase-like 1 n=1 Tax=Homarus americanus TaxID=6706 RepID=A0A8J5MX37_HOMAM|nr:Gamma-interferon-inducible lysosomal thiol reductase-like 1 [Homarus americanus]
MSNKYVQVSRVHISTRSTSKTCETKDNKSHNLLNAQVSSSNRTCETNRSGLALLERTVEYIVPPKTSDDARGVMALDLLLRIPITRRRQTRASYFNVCQPAWTMVLLSMVLTLVLINDMNTYGNLHYRRRREALLQGLAPSPSDEVPVYPTLHVEVYYEALCPDSRYFIMKQLTPAYEKLHKIMHIALVPYGKARTQEKDGKFIFDCQHGPVECRANMVHACVTNLVKEEAKQLAIVHCMIDKNDAPMKIGQKSQDDQKHILQDLHKILCKRFKGPKQPSC